MDANRTKLSVFVVLFVFGSAVLLTAALVATPGALIALVAQDSVPAYWRLYGRVVGGSLVALLGIGSLVAAVQLANAQDWVCNRFLGRPLADHEAPELASVVADMTLAAGLAEPPNLLVLDIDSHNAFAIGTARRRATIGVTRGMLSDYSLDELRAVVATLVARIVAGDIMFGTALAALMGPIRAVRESRKATGGAAAGCADAGCGDPGCSNAGCNGCSDLGDGCGDLGGDDGCGSVIGIVLFIALVIAVTYAAVVTAAWIVTLWGRALNRASYEKADAEGMLLLKDPLPMISALRTAIRSSTEVADGDQSYDGIFYAPTSGTTRIERAERLRFERLCEVLGVDGLQASLGE